jgi:small subunit ribosomal protein S17
MNESLKKIMEEQMKTLSIDPTMKGKDKKCPFTGNLKLRGKIFSGIVVSKDTHKTAIIEWSTRHFVKKYERFIIKKTKVAAHNPEVISAQIGDLVIICETRPISKTKNFVIIKNLGHSKDYMIKKESIDNDKKISDKKQHVSSEVKNETDNTENNSDNNMEDSE